MSQSEDPLQIALPTAFTPVSLSPDPASDAHEKELDSQRTASSSGNVENTTGGAIDDAGTRAATDPSDSPGPAMTQHQLLTSDEARLSWEAERAELDAKWKFASAIQRAEAEARRERIAAERATLGETWEKLNREAPLRGPPNPRFLEDRDVGEGASSRGSAGESSRAGLKASPHGASSPETGAKNSSLLEHGQSWEEIADVPSLESSFPSLSFPEKAESASSPDFSPGKRAGARQHHHHLGRHHNHSEHHEKTRHVSQGSKGKAESGSGRGGKEATTSVAPQPPPPLPASATLSIFDGRLSKRARLIAFFSALSINLLLPFVNGVMLGFGEIFARSLVVRLGWKMPGLSSGPAGVVGGAATAVGIRASGGGSSKRT